MTVVYPPDALRELDEIWIANAQSYSAGHAHDYVIFLRGEIASLATSHAEGKRVHGFPTLRSITLRRRPRGEGHVVIYEIWEETVAVLHIFHTKMDVFGRLKTERR